MLRQDTDDTKLGWRDTQTKRHVAMITLGYRLTWSSSRKAGPWELPPEGR
jgi:hypothetical protein